MRNKLVYILDKKPDATKDKKGAWQLYHYAKTLSFRTKIPLLRMRRGLFDENDYFEFSPAEGEIRGDDKKTVHSLRNGTITIES